MVRRALGKTPRMIRSSQRMGGLISQSLRVSCRREVEPARDWDYERQLTPYPSFPQIQEQDLGEGECTVIMKISIFTNREVTTLSQNRLLILGEGDAPRLTCCKRIKKAGTANVQSFCLGKGCDFSKDTPQFSQETRLFQG